MVSCYMVELFFKHPLSAISYAFLILAILSIWIHRKIWVWGSLLIVSGAFAYYGKLVEPHALIPLILVAGCYFFASEEIPGFWRLFSCASAVVITLGLYTHFVKGFNNIPLFLAWRSSLDATPLNIYANYDKGVVALLILGLYLPIIRTRNEFYKMLLATIPWTLLTITAILFLSDYFHLVKWDPKFPLITGIWLLIQLFLVVIPEEVFYRGFIQHEIAKNLKIPLSGLFAVLLTSLIFALIHILFIPKFTFILCTFVTSLLYGTIYQLTGKIESSILTHYITNITHFFLFTYPMLQK